MADDRMAVLDLLRKAGREHLHGGRCFVSTRSSLQVRVSAPAI
jgi:hypothetical protein